ncbi:uncharacterized protein CcaverHIS019_0304600 [Cutaneotrichosporon cavernicola]|uniref:Mitochondrial carrier n=1 Tax=Cutaneotrichosporon cavernicola TaxID=279322 RepID=A0AA48IB31_9TREE|nr:uncharacterized protein CcaverHIS019_0304600 [Cutaneotrichosporon cavernicola]BEI90390.1 hypothetical protein CcaverHIS019_0304600 [Cutaneotrichosporon cavernicola]BEI98166.1 hypothetical protein CcaverHIS631_0304650 [Cutaneotrichosporon cavernicola]BEJ05943.1 hypothetical protein CcaverHIS641_0304650 [Cutaneotrichosporon cavernicola]
MTTSPSTPRADSRRQPVLLSPSGPPLSCAIPGLPGKAAALTTHLNVPVDHGLTTTLLVPKQSEEVAIPQPNKATSAGAAFTRSLLLFIGFLFRRPSKLFRPNRLDTWAGLRRLAESADQNLSPTFVRSILKLKGGPMVLAASLLPPLLVNTTLGFLLFSSHSFFSLALARVPYFQRGIECDPEDENDLINFTRLRDPLGDIDGDYGDKVEGTPDEEEITLENVLRGPKIIPKHPTLLSAIAGAGAGVIQGAAFTPIENVVRLIQQSASSLSANAARFLHLPTPQSAQLLGPPPSSPVEALRTFLAHDTWHKSRQWWTGWRWAVARDAMSYSVFFATFDVTRRVGVRVKAVMSRRAGGPVDGSAANAEDEAAELRAAARAPPSQTPTSARLAQALTIVTGGVVAAHLAEISGRPFRACQRYASTATAESLRFHEAGKAVPYRCKHPLKYVWRHHGLRGFFHRDDAPLAAKHKAEAKAKGPLQVAARLAGRVVWRVASVGPWGIGFLVFAWIGGEV